MDRDDILGQLTNEERAWYEDLVRITAGQMGTIMTTREMRFHHAAQTIYRLASEIAYLRAERRTSTR